MNTKIFDYLNIYASTPDPQYAIMLRGKWGCGKTHFIKGWLNKFEVKDFADDADFFASHLSPITIFRYKFDKMLIAKGFVCVTDGLKKGIYLSRIPHDLGFIPHDFAYAVKQKGFFAIETGFSCIWSKLHLILK